MRDSATFGPTVFGWLAAVGLLGFAIVTTLLTVQVGVSPLIALLAWTFFLGVAVLEQQFAVYRTTATATDPASALAEEVRLEVTDLAATLSVRPPTVTVLETDAPVAGVATLPGVSNLLVSEGFLEAVDDDERRAILAHELAHVAGRDGVVTTAGAAVANAVGVATVWTWALSGTSPRTQLLGVLAYQLCYLGRSVNGLALVTNALAVFLPTVVLALVRTISRRQEYRADAVASRCVGDPRPLVRGIRRLELRAHTADPGSGVRWEGASTPAEQGRLERLLATHPPFDRRVDRLLGRDRN